MVFDSSHADQKSILGSHISFNLNPPLEIKGAQRCSICVDEASLWWTSPNISSNLGNNKLYFSAKKASTNSLHNFVFTIPNGLYNIESLNTWVQSEMHNQDVFIENETTAAVYPFEFTEGYHLSKVQIKINAVDCSIDFSNSDDISDLLGFTNSISAPGAGNVPKYILGNQNAKFNHIEYFLLHTNLVDEGIPVSNRLHNTIARIPITSKVGYTQLYNPTREKWLSANNLLNEKVSQVYFTITDQNNKAIDMNGDPWSVSIILKYE
jgi:hypothetical protein